MSCKWLLVAPTKIVVHAPCPDGYACDLIVRKHFQLEHKVSMAKVPTIEYTHGVTKLNPDDFKGEHVWILDYCPPATLLSQISSCAASVVVLDHHASEPVKKEILAMQQLHMPNVYVVLDTSGVVCGALLTYRLLNGDHRPVPEWLAEINRGDTNLCNSRTEEQRAYQAGLTAAPLNRDTLAQRAAEAVRPQIISQGRKIISDRQQRVEKAIKTMKLVTVRHVATGKSYRVPHVVIEPAEEPAPGCIGDVSRMFWESKENQQNADMLAIRWSRNLQPPFAWEFSLRAGPLSTEDLGAFANRYKLAGHSGGGHPAAAGIQLKDPTAVELPSLD